MSYFWRHKPSRAGSSSRIVLSQEKRYQLAGRQPADPQCTKFERIEGCNMPAYFQPKYYF